MEPDHDVVIVGDGPAGASVAAACRQLGLDVVVVGQGAPWPNRYGSWLDDVPGLPASVFAATRDRVVVTAVTRREIARPYGMIDNGALRDHLRLDDHLVRDAMRRMTEHRSFVDVDLLEGGSLTGRVVVDATGGGRAVPPAWQTAYGVVVDSDVVRSQFTTDAVTLMDWSVVGDVPTFCYAVPIGGRWLVQETALARRRPVTPDELRDKLSRRIGAGVVGDSEAAGRVEQVRIPLGLPMRKGSDRVVPFGAAAGMIHPVTGYSVAAALRAAPALAQAIAAGGELHEAVWPRGVRRTRALHEYGLDAVLRLDPFRTADFFEAFFALPVERWSPYLWIDSAPGEVARAMRGAWRGSPWSVRRRLTRLDRRLGALVRS
jgi:lycopene beta-cyclase